MLPNGILGIWADTVADVDRFIESHRSVCSEHQEIHIERLAARTTALGGVTSSAAKAAFHLSREAGNGSIGVFDGIAYDEWIVEKQPHRLLGLSVKEIDAGANGLFLAAAADGAQLCIVTDPWGSLPVYHWQGHGCFAFSCSLHALHRFANTDISVLNGGGGVSQLLTFGTTFDGQTAYPGISRLGRAIVCFVRRNKEGFSQRSEEYFSPEVEPSEYRGIDNDIVDSFRAAVRKVQRQTVGGLVATLSGGLDSRVIAAAVAAERVNATFVTHAVHEGHDVRIAREVARRLQLPHHVVPLPTDLPLDQGAQDFLCASNGAIAFDNYHVMWAFPRYAEHGRLVMDGVHTSIEGRWFLRNNSHRAKNRESLFRLAAVALRRRDILRYVREPLRHIRVAEEILHSLLPDPAEFASPGCCADVFNVRCILPNHGVDGALLENHYLRFVSPYLDREYVSVISRVSERKRWQQHPQRLLVRRLAPQLLRVPRSYSDVITWPTDNPYLLRVPVALERLYEKARLQRIPTLHAKLTRRATSLGYNLVIKSDDPILDATGALFDLSGIRNGTSDGENGLWIPHQYHGLLHLLWIIGESSEEHT
jgi:asparagine synthetase B (glutamine-hydrolysing)